eukprot:TRINITY_DN54757_c0_g1_i1.p2 TRINITY_DN54757_c0_g1~~TRINITY_DN54757_c0_g1_i1.p2  ORF type:complete len:136 (+),score=20.92 TRINITY_DN54757_c0_g1_i1:27-434(+)
MSSMRGRHKETGMRSELFGGVKRNEGSYGPPKQDLATAETEQHMEAQNEEEIARLTGTVQMLKDVTIEIGQEVKAQNRLLAGMGNEFMKANAGIQSTMTKLKNMTAHGGSKHMCMLVVFVFMVFLFMWWLLKMRR